MLFATPSCVLVRKNGRAEVDLTPLPSIKILQIKIGLLNCSTVRLLLVCCCNVHATLYCTYAYTCSALCKSFNFRKETSTIWDLQSKILATQLTATLHCRCFVVRQCSTSVLPFSGFSAYGTADRLLLIHQRLSQSECCEGEIEIFLPVWLQSCIFVCIDFFDDECAESSVEGCSEFVPEVPFSEKFDGKAFERYCR